MFCFHGQCLVMQLCTIVTRRKLLTSSLWVIARLHHGILLAFVNAKCFPEQGNGQILLYICLHLLSYEDGTPFKKPITFVLLHHL